jgi:hypothetical protein
MNVSIIADLAIGHYAWEQVISDRASLKPHEGVRRTSLLANVFAGDKPPFSLVQRTLLPEEYVFSETPISFSGESST